MKLTKKVTLPSKGSRGVRVPGARKEPRGGKLPRRAEGWLWCQGACSPTEASFESPHLDPLGELWWFFFQRFSLQVRHLDKGQQLQNPWAQKTQATKKEMRKCVGITDCAKNGQTKEEISGREKSWAPLSDCRGNVWCEDHLSVKELPRYFTCVLRDRQGTQDRIFLGAILPGPRTEHQGVF